MLASKNVYAIAKMYGSKVAEVTTSTSGPVNDACSFVNWQGFARGIVTPVDT